jgi:hypothetical protein
MDLKLNYSNVTTKDEAYNAVKKAVTPEMLEKWQVKADISYNDFNVVAKGKGFELNIDFLDEYCEVKLTLSFLLKPLRKKIMAGIEKQFSRVI